MTESPQTPEPTPGAAPSPETPEPPITLAAPRGTELPASGRLKARRLSKNLGIAVCAIVAVLVGAIVLGIGERQRATRAQGERGSAIAEARASPATAAASAITQGLPNGAFTQGAARPGSDDSVRASGSAANAGTANIRTASGLLVPEPASPSAGAGSLASGNAPPSAEERALERAYLDELEALRAGTGAGTKLPPLGSSNASTLSANAIGSGLPPELLSVVNQLAAGGASSGPADANPGLGLDEMAEQNGWARKSDFGRVQTRAASASGAALQPPRSPYLIRAGWTIPAILEQVLNSDLPGEIRALVTQNVYDTATGEYLLIPQGTRLVGTYDSAVGYGQGALQAVWTRLVFPDASVLDLDSARAQDASGRAGLRFRTNYHTGRLLGAALLTSLFSAGYEIAQGNRSGTLLDGRSASDRAARGAAEEISRLGAEVTRRNLNIAPTIEIPAGFRLQVFVAEDLALRAPYSPDVALR